MLAIEHDNGFVRQEDLDALPTPEVEPHHMWIWRAWDRLSPDRPWYSGGMGPSMPGSIPFQHVTAWAAWHTYGEQETTHLDTVLRAMDKVFLEYTHNSIREQTKSKKG